MLPSTTPRIRPISIQSALAYFGGYGLLTFIGFHIIYPLLPQMGLSEADSLVLVLTIPLALMLVPPLVLYQRSGEPMTLAAIRAYIRFPAIERSDFAWALLIFVVAILGSSLVGGITQHLIARGLMPMPDNIPLLFDPRGALFDPASWDAFVGGTIRGNWRALFLYFLMLFFNIVGEEVLWRGYILPRQEQQHGRWAWLIHGLMWCGFHFFKWWDLLNLLPICLIIAYVSQRTGRNWPAFIAHYAINGIGFLLALALVVGWL